MKKQVRELIIRAARKITGPFPFYKRLPSEFEHQKIVVTSRSDIRLLAPGFERSASDLLRIVRRFVNQGDVVWDIGSNLGILSVCSALKAGRGGAVFSVEANPDYANFQLRTVQNLGRNSATVSILCAAISDSWGIVDFNVPKKGHARGHLSQIRRLNAGDAETHKQVVSVTLDWLLNQWAAPDFIKIDIEGAELLAIKGGDAFFTQVRPVCYIESATENREEMTSFFRFRDYDLFSIDQTGRLSPVDRFLDDTIAVPKEKSRNMKLS